MRIFRDCRRIPVLILYPMAQHNTRKYFIAIGRFLFERAENFNDAAFQGTSVLQYIVRFRKCIKSNNIHLKINNRFL